MQKITVLISLFLSLILNTSIANFSNSTFGNSVYIQQLQLPTVKTKQLDGWRP